ncbi:ABC transporter permease [Photobacterium sp. ZSDE20]|uniref:Autoinducer 2 import system permease protein LsrD n=1 Tax=Photobacterium pectinilyticum TaxID=2906793 RepID=A0ABT1N506_9GAMM|nr:ABC transporter permease [Photobacterium sp. ZSDE20]MCQ1059642.1 ABC transporter permease [Photobacterium sp. ZSDE20]MDD1825844.1 ABC transporter permease [Photobacterium sp. ZSDE20]
MDSVNKAVIENSAKQAGWHLPTWAKSWEALLLLTAVVVFLLNCMASPYFLDPWTLSDATFNFTEKAIIALPLALVIIVREIDISVASIIALCSVAMGYTAQAGVGVELICLVGLAVGVCCGLFNGLLVTRLNIPSIVVTIGTMSLFRGIAYILLGDQAIRDYPPAFEYFGQGYVFYVFSFEFVVFCLLAVLFYVLLQKTNFGRRTYAIGNNPTAAFYSGINVANHKLILFTLVGFFSAVASIMLTSRLGSTRPTIALGWELNIVTMVVLGGVSILGGSGTIIGVVISVFLMGLVTVGLGLLNIPGIIMSIIIGSMLIGVIALPTLIKFFAEKRRV